MFSDGMQLYTLMSLVVSIMLYILVGFAILLAVLMRDIEYVTSSPFLFLIECVILFILPVIPLSLFVYTQKIDWSVVRKLTIDIGTKLVVLHIIFTIAGIYTVFFEKEYAHPGAERFA